ncbi:D-alanyl-D-alanine carboxypeptidase/D-alanyl-D-alanine-endopeptidase [Hyphomonas sp. WL0036]|uniref:D-alanyl-D-alanine carboxypeptidase/D-alanyl-D-alanine endopeptidase n=1 Tax=Hyphomonas sediminis TaxID=2866160 RepID=UPI001C7F0AE0|nr:D-alanyl-D-alanine carboxypeptidase/D-alanyl-D-alanine-endopeptidase [Hyphomonas sediminis]MBY9065615.1 D-alanyl-D-alanine carboxypeptidase/D-alanyl-D-alanine-endopeptidase [Hyphomonas sediminis]
MMSLRAFRPLLTAALIGLTACATQPPPPAPLEQTQVAGVRWGAVVSTLDGQEVFALRWDERFTPASNTKIFTTAAAFAYLSDLETPNPAAGTSVWLSTRGEGEAPDLILMGAGDAGLTDSPDCVTNCLHQLADAVVAAGITRVADVIGDDSALPADPWGQGWSWNNFSWYYAAPISALTVNENTLGLQVTPAPEAGFPATVSWLPGDDLLILQNDTVTGYPKDEATLRMMRVPGSDVLRLTGSLPAGTGTRAYAVAVGEPAHAAAQRFIRLLAERGVVVEGIARAQHEAGFDAGAMPVELARLTPAPLIDSVRRILVNSQNLHAELLLRRIAAARGALTGEGGPEILAALAAEAGLTRTEIELFDGSGMSSYNRVTPRGMVAFLRWAETQPWGEAWRAALPVGGADGTLARRFKGTSLEGKVYAKTGSLHGVNALSGYMTAKSGRVLVFAIFANDRPAEAPSIIAEMDAALVQIAEEN